MIIYKLGVFYPKYKWCIYYSNDTKLRYITSFNHIDCIYDDRYKFTFK